MRTFDDMPLDNIPRCTAIKANYYVHNGLYVEHGADASQVVRYAAELAAEHDKKSFSVKFADADACEKMFGEFESKGAEYTKILKCAAKKNPKITGIWAYTNRRLRILICVFYKK